LYNSDDTLLMILYWWHYLAHNPSPCRACKRSHRCSARTTRYRCLHSCRGCWHTSGGTLGTKTQLNSCSHHDPTFSTGDDILSLHIQLRK